MITRCFYYTFQVDGRVRYALFAGCCRIKYIGRNCRVVLVGGVLLKAEQEVMAPPGTQVILNFNNKVCCCLWLLPLFLLLFWCCGLQPHVALCHE